MFHSFSIKLGTLITILKQNSVFFIDLACLLNTFEKNRVLKFMCAMMLVAY